MMSKVILNKTEIARALDRIAYEIVEHSPKLDDLVLIGIRTRRALIAERLQKLLSKITKKVIPIGILDITLYRDDLALRTKQPIVRQTEIPFDISLGIDAFISLTPVFSEVFKHGNGRNLNKTTHIYNICTYFKYNLSKLFLKSSMQD